MDIDERMKSIRTGLLAVDQFSKSDLREWYEKDVSFLMGLNSNHKSVIAKLVEALDDSNMVMLWVLEHPGHLDIPYILKDIMARNKAAIKAAEGK